MECLRTQNPAVVAAEKINGWLEKSQKTPVLLLVSGGSALAILKYLDTEVIDSRVTLGVLDERFSADKTVNNFAQLAATTFFAKASLVGISTINTRVEVGETLSALTKRTNEAVTRWRKKNPQGVIIATLGLGIDGHTAGIMPGYVAKLDDFGQMMVGYEVSAAVSLHTKRLTATPSFLQNEVSYAVAFVTGEEKAKVLGPVLLGVGEIEQCPALLWREMANMVVVTDCSV